MFPLDTSHPGTRRAPGSGRALWDGKSPSREGEAKEAIFPGARLGVPACSRLPSAGTTTKGSPCALRFSGGYFFFSILK